MGREGSMFLRVVWLSLLGLLSQWLLYRFGAPAVLFVPLLAAIWALVDDIWNG